MAPRCASKKKKVLKIPFPQVLKRSLLLGLGFSTRESHKRKLKLKVISTQESPKNQEIYVGPSDKPPQKEIGSSTIDEKVSEKSIQDTSILPNTQIPGEQQVEVGSTRQNEEFREPTLEQIYTTGSLGKNLTWGDQ
jgi:hypothetical protein